LIYGIGKAHLATRVGFSNKSGFVRITAISLLWAVGGENQQDKKFDTFSALTRPTGLANNCSPRQWSVKLWTREYSLRL